MSAMTEDGNTQLVPAPGGLAKVQILTAAGGWPASVVVNGNDVSRQLDGVAIIARPQQIPRIVLEFLGDVSFEGEGIVEVHTPAPVDEQSAKERVRDWLNSLDWALLQATAAEGAMAAPIGEAFRAALLDALDRDW